MNASQANKPRVECLDGLRGLAALWVVVGHGMILTGWRVPVLGSPDLGVDLFIMLSGFLMVFQYQARERAEPWTSPETWARFWIRRFFRIAPLYYLALAAALILGPSLFAARHSIDLFLGSDPQLATRYIDASATNVVAHLTFLFGLSPKYTFRTALPDWSIGLEMQFYAVFPFLMLVVRKWGWPIGAAAVAVVGASVAFAAQHHGVTFPMPAFLPLKLHVFLCGMLLAAAIGRDRATCAVYLLLAIVLMAIPLGGNQSARTIAMRETLLILFAALVLHGELTGGSARLIERVSATLGNRWFHWMGELSFGVYLVHLLILQPVVARLIDVFGHDISAPTRFALAMAITIPIAYAIAVAGFLLIERPGQQIGRRVLRRDFRGPTTRSA